MPVSGIARRRGVQYCCPARRDDGQRGFEQAEGGNALPQQERPHEFPFDRSDRRRHAQPRSFVERSDEAAKARGRAASAKATRLLALNQEKPPRHKSRALLETGTIRRSTF